MIGFNNIGSRQMDTRDLGDSLQFVLKRNPQRANLIIGMTVIGGFAFVSWW